MWRVAKRLSYIEDARCLKVKAVRPTKLRLFKQKLHVSVTTDHRWAIKQYLKEGKI